MHGIVSYEKMISHQRTKGDICRLITAYLLLWEKINASGRFWCVKCTSPKGECPGQASKLKHECIILSKFSSTK